MKYLLYIIALVLIISWALGYFVYHSSAYIHILLGIALAAVLVQNFKR